MSTDILEINLNKETTFDFELSITGISANDAKVRFGIELPGFTMQIPCSRGDDKMWNVTVPALDEMGIEEGQYTFTIELIANGYHFAPVKGTASLKPVAEVIGTVPRKSIEVNVSGITKKEKEEEKPKPKAKKKKKKVEEVAEEIVEDEEEAEDVVEEIKEEVKESVVDKMLNKLEPFKPGKSILSQMQEKQDEEDNRPETDKRTREILKNL